MRIPATINGQQYVLDYGTNPRGQVAGVAIYSADGTTDLSAELDSTPTEYAAWDIARAHREATVPATPQSAVQPPVCKDCAHFVCLSKTESRFARCAAPQHGVDLVFGQPVMPACEHQRDSDGKGRCGQSGVFFVAKASASTAFAQVAA
ncbi:MAG: hypothetical protein KA181_01065 [Xylophilus sp.]|nr:hypothetical protein [Xylophilus sp.]